MIRDNSQKEMLSNKYLLCKRQSYLFGLIETGMAARVVLQIHYVEQEMIDDIFDF